MMRFQGYATPIDALAHHLAYREKTAADPVYGPEFANSVLYFLVRDLMAEVNAEARDRAAKADPEFAAAMGAAA